MMPRLVRPWPSAVCRRWQKSANVYVSVGFEERIAIHPFWPFGHESSAALVGSPPQSFDVVVPVEPEPVETVTVVVAVTVEGPGMLGSELVPGPSGERRRGGAAGVRRGGRRRARPAGEPPGAREAAQKQQGRRGRRNPDRDAEAAAAGLPRRLQPGSALQAVLLIRLD